MINDIMQLMEFSFRHGFWNGVIAFMFFGLVSATIVGFATGFGNMCIVKHITLKQEKDNAK
jgi:hypothetical protein